MKLLRSYSVSTSGSKLFHWILVHVKIRFKQMPVSIGNTALRILAAKIHLPIKLKGLEKV